MMTGDVSYRRCAIMKMKYMFRISVVLLSIVMVFAMIPGVSSADEQRALSGESADEHHIMLQSEQAAGLTPAKDGTLLAKLVDEIGGADGLYGEGLNGFDMFDHLGYVYLGWRTTGGIWQNQVIGDYIMSNLKAAGYATTDDNVEAPYGTKPASDRSSSTDDDYAWEIQYQGTDNKDLGDTWDPEYASLQVQLVNAAGQPLDDAEGDRLAKDVGGEWWGYNPTTEVYQKNFARLFGLNYSSDIAALPTTSEKLLKMRDVLLTSKIERDKRTTVDDYEYIKRNSIGEPNKEAVLNKRTRLAWNSSFTDPAGTDPAEAAGLDGEIVYVGEIITMSENSEGIPNEDLAGKIILTDSSMYRGCYYAERVGAVGAASKRSVHSFLCPKDESGNILEPWYDSSRYAEGYEVDQSYDLMKEGRPIVEWQFSNKQYDSLRALLDRAKKINAEVKSEEEKVKVTGRQIAIGDIYPMTKTEGGKGAGQAVAIAEVKGSVHPEKRVMICAHVQEPGCGDNATGVAALLDMAVKYKKLVDSGKVDRPKCTVTFMWGDEMNMASFWMDGHAEEKANLICAIDMDMTGQDPEKTGGVMRIEKTPDPSVTYSYTRDGVPWNEPDEEIPSPANPYYDKTYSNRFDEGFVRLPDSDTLWGTNGAYDIFNQGWYLNDLYMYVTNTVIDRHDSKFQVDVCPYEGGSDHSEFLEENIPALLTWHFTDYTYHTSSDTLYMASPRELESVGITSLVCALMMCGSCTDADAAADILGAVKEAGLKRMDAEAVNTDHHLVYAKAGHSTVKNAFAEEKEVLSAWGAWYDEAISSVATLFDGTSETLNTAIRKARAEMKARTDKSLSYAEKVLGPAREKEVKNVKLKSKNRRITVSWKKTAGVTGYEVSYKLKSAKKYKVLKKTKKLKVVTKKLKKGKKYSFRVRAYTKKSGWTVYGLYSKAKTIKCK